jgi:hypothetical protein
VLYDSSKKSEEWWKSFAEQLSIRGYLSSKATQSGFGSTVVLTKKAIDYLKTKNNASNVAPIKFIETTEMRKLSSSSKTATHISLVKPPINA